MLCVYESERKKREEGAANHGTPPGQKRIRSKAIFERSGRESGWVKREKIEGERRDGKMGWVEENGILGETREKSYEVCNGQRGNWNKWRMKRNGE